jgi:hypothetical protein
VYKLSSFVTKSVFGVTNFSIALAVPDIAIDITGTTLAAASSATTYHIAAFTYEIPTNDLIAYNTTIRSNAGKVTFTSQQTDVLGNVVDSEGELVPVINVNAVYAYAWAEYVYEGQSVHSAIVPASSQITSTDPYPRIMQATYQTDESILVSDATLFAPSGNIDKYYLFATTSDITKSDVENFVTIGTILSNTVFSQNTTSALGTNKDFTPDLIEGNVYSLPPTNIWQAFTNITINSSEVVEIVGNVAYNVYLAAFAVDNGIGSSSMNLYQYTTLGEKSKTDHHPYLDIRETPVFDNYTSNHHTVTFNINELLAKQSDTCNAYAFISTRDLYKNVNFDLNAFNIDVRIIKNSNLIPIKTGVSSLPTVETFELSTAWDDNDNEVELFTVNEAYLYVWAKSVTTNTYSPVVRMVIQGYDYVPTSIVLNNQLINSERLREFLTVNDQITIGDRTFTNINKYFVEYINPIIRDTYKLITTITRPTSVSSLEIDDRKLSMIFVQNTRVYLIYVDTYTGPTPNNVELIGSWTSYSGANILLGATNDNYLSPLNRDTNVAYLQGTTVSYYKDFGPGLYDVCILNGFSFVILYGDIPPS